jgi:TPR repeat protein
MGTRGVRGIGIGAFVAAMVLSSMAWAPSLASAQRTYTFPAYQVQAMCMSGNPDACYEQGLRQYWGDEVPADRYQGYRSWQQACAGNHSQACWEVAYGYQEGTYLPANPPLALQMFVQGCQRSHPASCNSVGYAYENAVGTPPDLATAFRYYDMACNLGDSWGCRNEGIFLRDGRPGISAPDAARGIPLLARACSLGLAQACTEAAQSAPPIPIPQYCRMGAPSYGPITIGTPVTLGYHTPWEGDANWADQMGQFVGQRTFVTSLEGLDEVGCPVVRVAVDGGQYFWRIRNMGL